jgi:hypothetical protein
MSKIIGTPSPLSALTGTISFSRQQLGAAIHQRQQLALGYQIDLVDENQHRRLNAG